MKRITVLLLFLFGLSSCFSQNANSLSELNLIHISTGDTMNKVIENQYGPIIVVSFSIFCGPCMKELNALSEICDEWGREYNAKIIAVSNDFPEKYRDKLIRFNKTHNYKFELYLDYGQTMANYFYSLETVDKKDFSNYDGKQRILNPQTFIIDKNGTLIKQIRGFIPGNEEKIKVILDNCSR